MFSFSEIVGHEQIKEHMQAAIRDKKPFHAYLFQGEEGVGCVVEGVSRDSEYYHGHYVDTVMFGLTAEDLKKHCTDSK